jgi:hypothetical protein
MTKDQLLKEIDDLSTMLALARASIEHDYLSAAATYLDDVEGEATRLAIVCEEISHDIAEPIAENFLHINNPAYIPYRSKWIE